MGNCNNGVNKLFSKELYTAIRGWIQAGNLDLVEDQLKNLVGLYDILTSSEKKMLEKIEVKYLRKKFAGGGLPVLERV